MSWLSSHKQGTRRVIGPKMTPMTPGPEPACKAAASPSSIFLCQNDANDGLTMTPMTLWPETSLQAAASPSSVENAQNDAMTRRAERQEDE